MLIWCWAAAKMFGLFFFSLLEVKKYYDRNYQAFFLFVLLNFNSKQVKLQH